MLRRPKITEELLAQIRQTIDNCKHARVLPEKDVYLLPLDRRLKNRLLAGEL